MSISATTVERSSNFVRLLVRMVLVLVVLSATLRTRKDLFPGSLARAQAGLSLQKRVIPPVAPESADFRKWDKTRNSS